MPVFVDETQLVVSKTEFARILRAEGVDLNPHYAYLAADWSWLRPYLADDFSTPNARTARDLSFVLYLNENYGDQEAADVVNALVKLERVLGVPNGGRRE